MELNFTSEKAIYLQLAELIENSILSGAFPEETPIPSTTEISLTYKINPATALKGINLLVDEKVIYKKRGVGMFVASGALTKLQEKHDNAFKDTYIKPLLEEAGKLNISKESIIDMIKES